MLDEAQWIILQAGQTLENEAWLIESTKQGAINARNK